MTSNTDPRTKGQAVFLAAIMFLSVIAMTATVIGGAAAADVQPQQQSAGVAQGPVAFYATGALDLGNKPSGSSAISSSSQTIEIVFDDPNGNLSSVFNDNNWYNSGNNISVTNRTGGEATVNAFEFEHNSDEELTQVALEVDENLTVRSTITFTNTSTAIDGVDYSVTTTTTTIESGEADDDAFAGETIAIYEPDTNENGTFVNIDDPDGDLDRGLGTQSNVRVYSKSGDFGEGDMVNVTFNDDSQFNLTLHEFGQFPLDATGDVESLSASITEASTILQESWEPNENEPRDIEFQVFNTDADPDERTNRTIGTYDADGNINVDFSNLEPGNYSVVATDVLTGISTSVDAQVDAPTVADPAEWTFQTRFLTEEQGDVAEIPLQLEDDTGTSHESFNITFELGADGSDYNVTAQIDPNADAVDAGELVVEFNTYYAGNDSVQTVQLADSSLGSASITSESTINHESFRLPADTLSMILTDTTGQEKPRTGELQVTPRSTDGITTMIAPDGADILGADDPVSAIDQYATQRDYVAQQDQLIFELEANGIFGYGVGDNQFNGTDANDLATGLSLVAEQLNEPRLQTPETFNDSASWVNLVEDEENDTIYIVIDSQDIVDEVLNVRPADGVGNQFDLTFNVGEENPYVESAQSVNTSFEIQPRTVSFEAPDQVVQDSEVVFEGESNLAPGSEEFMDQLDFRVEAFGPDGFIQSADSVTFDGEMWQATVSDLDTFEPQDVNLVLETGQSSTETTHEDVPMVSPQAAFDISNLEHPEEVTVGESFEVSLDVENTGTQSGSTTIELSIGDISESQTVDLDVGESQTVTFEPTAFSGGDYSVVVSETESGNELTGSITFNAEAEPDFELSNLQAPSSVVTGNAMQVSVDVENVGDGAGITDLTLDVGGTTATNTVQLDAGASTTVTFTIVAPAPGDYTASVTESNTGASVSADVTVNPEPSPAAFELSDPQGPDSAQAGDDATFSASIENTGDQSGMVTVTFNLGGVSEQQIVSLDAGEASRVTFTVTLDVGAAENVTWSITELDSQSSVTGEIDVSAAPTPEPTPTPTPEPTPEPTPTPTEADDGDGQPGFGLVIAVLAMLGAALLAYRRYE